MRRFLFHYDTSGSRTCERDLRGHRKPHPLDLLQDGRSYRLSVGSAPEVDVEPEL